ncbi:MAG: lytic transglycosylase domain-containing protein [Sphingomonadales bacterium]
MPGSSLFKIVALSVSLTVTALLPARAQDDVAASDLDILSTADVTAYQQIFDIQTNGDWRTADRLISGLENRVLMGHVLFQRYMHPTAYRSEYRELAGWMARYGDHPGAERIYRLAQRRAVRGGPALHQPVALQPKPDLAEPTQPTEVAIITREEAREAKEHRRNVLRVQSQVGAYLRRGEPGRAEKRVWAANQDDLLDPGTFGRTLGEIAGSYFFMGQDEKALALARLSGAASGGEHFQGDWFGGLAAWRLGDCARAAEHFERAAEASTANSWNVAGAAFWAARAHLSCRNPERVNELLELAAQHPKTFYGMIAARQLGHDILFTWDHPPLDRGDFEDLVERPGVGRALALTQIGRDDWADMEMRYVWLRSPNEWHGPLLGLAARMNLPSTQLRGARTPHMQSVTLTDSVLYPVPSWEPTGGFSLDRALIFAFMRQESAFNANATSHAGARGLMQLMPRTASYISRDRTLQSAQRTRLYEPGLNMQLGQRYLDYLLNEKEYGGNLFFTASAYNGGPGNLSRWRRQNHFRDDPLMFVESIPLRETRLYVERVISNLWIYRMRMDQPTPSLDDVARGHWPIYRPQDNQQSGQPG